MHPAHVPLEAEAEALQVGRPGDAGPRGGLLGHRRDAGVLPVHGRVHLLEERERLQVLPAAVPVRRPLAVLARVVQIQHRGDGVDPQPVGVELLAPVQGVRHQEVAHLAAAVVEHQRAPVRVLAPARVAVLVQGSAVEPGEGPLVAREVRRHPVQDHPDAGLVQPVDQVPEVVRVTEPGGGRVEAGDLVAPRAAERVLHHRHELDVREAEVGHVLGELVGQLPVGQAGPPRPEVHLVHAHRLLVRPGLGAPLHPVGVLPVVARLVHHGRGRRRHLGVHGERVGLLPPGAVAAQDPVLVPLAGAGPGDEDLPDPARAQRPHRPAGVGTPAGEVADHPYTLGTGRPHGEGDPAVARVRAENRPQPLVPALPDQVQVQLAECGRVPVRVVDRLAVHLDPVVEHRAGHGRLEDALVVHPGHRVPVVADQHGHVTRAPAQRADDGPAVARVRAQRGVWIVRGAGDQLVHVRPSPVTSFAIERSGTGSQCGRCRAS